MEKEESNYKSIKEWREDERPRERLEKKGAASLSDSELLAIIIGHGTRSKSAVDLGKELLEKYKNLTNLTKCSIKELRKVHGIGPVKAINLSAAFEIGKRLKGEEFNIREAITKPDDILRILVPRFISERLEKFELILLNNANIVLDIRTLSNGSVDSTVVDVKEAMRIALLEGATAIILVHNHPSGNLNPSSQDIALTKNFVEAGKFLNIKILDHFIISGEKYYSFKEKNLI